MVMAVATPSTGIKAPRPAPNNPTRRCQRTWWLRTSVDWRTNKTSHPEKTAAYVDLENPKEPDQARILGAFFPGEARMIWVVKMWGPSEAVGKEKANFEAFAKSLRFNGN